MKTQAGQTLIETVVAIFILVMGVTAAVGLAIYVLNASTNVTKQIIATGLAREGIEAVKNMRDTNWLKDTLDVDDCYNYITTNNDADCYEQWLQPTGGADATPDEDQKPKTAGFDLDYNGNDDDEEVYLTIDNNANNRYWRLNNPDCGVSENDCGWGLDFDPTIDGSFIGFYYVSNFDDEGEKHGSSEYYRKIILEKETDGEYRSELERLSVIVQVWWADKKCPRVGDWTQAAPRCRLELVTYLTNWKDY